MKKKFLLLFTGILFLWGMLFTGCSSDSDSDDADRTPPAEIIGLNAVPNDSSVFSTWTNPADKDFYELITKLNEFCNIDMQPSSDDTMRTIIIECVPKDDSVSFVAGFHAIWSVMPSKPGAKIDTLRFFIDTEYLHAFVINEDALEEEDNDEE